jgi:hypothetical protein
MAVPAIYERLLAEYCSAMKEHFGERLKSICVFGSVAKGNPKPESDIDVLAVVEGLPESLDGRMAEAAEVHELVRSSEASRKVREAGRNPLISPLYFTPEELRKHPPIMLDLVEDAVILYDKGVLREELLKLKRRMEELGSKKVQTSKGHYWILKPGLKAGEVIEL